MRLTVNGDVLDAPAGARLDWLVHEVAGGPRGVAVAVNGDIVPRSAWDATDLAEGDRVEILSAAQGG